jgi:hypothetical protein
MFGIDTLDVAVVDRLFNVERGDVEVKGLADCQSDIARLHLARS